MKNSSTLLLRWAVLLLGFCIFGLTLLFPPQIAGLAAYLFPETKILSHLVFVQLYLTAVPFFHALYQTMKLLRLIDLQEAFSNRSVQCLRRIKKSAFLISLLYACGSPLYYWIADRDDAPGVLLIVLIILLAAFAVGIISAVLETLLQDAIRIKAENDLTV